MKTLQNKNLKKQKGFTLIEVVLYTALFTVITTLVISFAFEIVKNRVKNVAIKEVEDNAKFALTRLTQEIKEATDINVGSSTFGTNPGVLSLEMAAAWKNPTVFDVSSGTMRITHGSNSPANLTIDNVTVSNFVITNYSVGGYPKTVKLDLTVDYDNPENSEEYSASTSMSTSVTLRQ